MTQKTAVTSAGFLANLAREAVKIGRRKCLKMGSPLKDPPPPNRGSNLYQMRSGKVAACSKSDLDELVCEREKSKVGVW